MRSTTWLTTKAEVRPSPIEGRGLFAREPIAAGEAVVILGGTLLDDAGLRALDGTRYSSAATDEHTHVLLDSPNDAEYGNHCCDATTWMRDALTTEAAHDIAAGEEITIDYAVLTGIEDWSMECNCGAPLCRRIVTGADWRRPDVQRHYAGHFSPFLNRRIEALQARGAP
jgi:hypothetical protein